MHALVDSKLDLKLINFSDFPPVTDDHKPFWELGVDQILHLIPTPFPVKNTTGSQSEIVTP